MYCVLIPVLFYHSLYQYLIVIFRKDEDPYIVCKQEPTVYCVHLNFWFILLFIVIWFLSYFLKEKKKLKRFLQNDIIIGISDNPQGNKENCKGFRKKTFEAKYVAVKGENNISLKNPFVQPIFHNCRSGKDKLLFLSWTFLLSAKVDFPRWDASN